MQPRFLWSDLAVSHQITPDAIAEAHALGFRASSATGLTAKGPINRRFARSRPRQPRPKMQTRYIPVTGGVVSDADAAAFGQALRELPGPVLAYCRSGTRSTTLWSPSQAGVMSLPEILGATKAAGHDLAGVARRIANGGKTPTDRADASYDVVIVGAGAAGIAVAPSLQGRKRDLEIAVIDPADVHYYQPGWTTVSAGVFTAQETARMMGSLIPRGVHWIKSAVVAFEPGTNTVVLDGCRVVGYQRLVVAPGLKLDWNKVEGLVETLGRNGVSSNYRHDLAPYTWQLVQGLRSGRVLFTQPPMPIKCAGAPQKAMYLSGDAWWRNGALGNIDIQFMNAGGVLFGVKDYVPALMDCVKKYDATLNILPQPRGRGWSGASSCWRSSAMAASSCQASRAS